MRHVTSVSNQSSASICFQGCYSTVLVNLSIPTLIHSFNSNRLNSLVIRRLPNLLFFRSVLTIIGLSLLSYKFKDHFIEFHEKFSYLQINLGGTATSLTLTFPILGPSVFSHLFRCSLIYNEILPVYLKYLLLFLST